MTISGEWGLKITPLSSRQLDNAWLNVSLVEARVGDGVRRYCLIYYARYINETYGPYVVTLARLADGDCYSTVFTRTNYWSRNKAVYFGDWVVVTNVTLSQYYSSLYGRRRLGKPQINNTTHKPTYKYRERSGKSLG